MSSTCCGVWFVSLLVAVVVAACGDSDSDETSNRSTVDAAEIEQEIEQNLSSKTIDVKSVSCRDDVLSGAAVDEELERDLEAEGFPGATVDCPSEIKVKTGTTVTCPVAGAGGGVASVSFEFSDAAGAIDETSVDTGS